MSSHSVSNACACIDCPLATWRTAETIDKTPLGALHEAFKALLSDPVATTSLHSVMHYSSPTPSPTPASASASPSTKCCPTGEAVAPNKYVSVGTEEGPTTSPYLVAGLLEPDGFPKANQSDDKRPAGAMDDEELEAALERVYNQAGVDDEGDDDEYSQDESEDGYGIVIRVTTRQYTRRARSARPLPAGMRYRPVSRCYAGRNDSRTGQGKAKKKGKRSWTLSAP